MAVNIFHLVGTVLGIWRAGLFFSSSERPQQLLT